MLDSLPRRVFHWRPFVGVSDGFPPVVTADEVPPRPVIDRGIQSRSSSNVSRRIPCTLSSGMRERVPTRQLLQDFQFCRGRLCGHPCSKLERILPVLVIELDRVITARSFCGPSPKGSAPDLRRTLQRAEPNSTGVPLAIKPNPPAESRCSPQFVGYVPPRRDLP